MKRKRRSPGTTWDKHVPHVKIGQIKRNYSLMKGRLRQGENDPLPKGTPEQLKEAQEIVMKHQIDLMDYGDRDEFPDHIREEQKRLLHYALKGPRRGHFAMYQNKKLWQADIFYILTVTTSSKFIAEKYGVALRTIQDIRQGNDADWSFEYRLINRMKTALRSRMKQLHDGTPEPTVWAIKNVKGEVRHLVTSVRKAKEYAEAFYGPDWKEKKWKLEQVRVLN